MRKAKKLFAAAGITALSALMLAHPLVAWAECYCDISEPVDVIVKNWQTFRPRVTAMHSLNAYLAQQGGQGNPVYYIPMLEDIPNVRSRMYDCTDYAGTNKKFAAIYDGYFDVECYDALVRNPDGTYTGTPLLLKGKTGFGSERELTTLGYDFMLTSEYIQDIRTNGTVLSASYVANKLDLDTGSVDAATAIMDIYKAIGQEQHQITYVFVEDPGLTLESSPIQKEIHLQLAQEDSIDVSDGAGYVFVTRSNPKLYWDKAVHDNIILDSTSIKGSNSASTDVRQFGISATKTLTLSEFCAYAYEIMNIYGEPTMTTSEKSILLQLYGTSIPYQSVDAFAVKAIENFIAKGIISPDDDSSMLNWNAPIDPRYMLTILMRIADVNARMTYKDVQITINPTLLDKDYYAADISVDQSSIMEMTVDDLFAHIATYVDNSIPRSTVNTLKAGTNDPAITDFYIQNHLVVKDAYDNVHPFSSLVTTEGGSDSRLYSAYKTQSESVVGTTAFAECLGWDGDNLLINTYIKPVSDLLVNGSYHIHMVLPDGEISEGYISVEPGKRSSGSPSRGTSSSRYDDAEDEDWEEDEDDDWEDDPSWDLAATQTAVVIVDIQQGSESKIRFKPNKAGASDKTLAEIMQDTDDNGYGYLVPGDATDIHVKKISDTRYQIEGVKGTQDLQSRTTETGNASTGRMEGFVQKDKELIVSADWLKSAGFISDCYMDSSGVLVLTSKYNEIYLDKTKKIIVAGTTIYTLYDLNEDEIFYEYGNAGYFVNFRAVMGWTGDFLLFKDSGEGVVTVSIKGYPSESPNKNSLTDDVGAQKIYMKEIPAHGLLGDIFSEASMSQSVQGSNDSSRVKANSGRNSKYSISMTATYPFANWFIYSKGRPTSTDGTDADWLFVLKPKKVKVNGQDVTYDDTKSREILKTTLGELNISPDEISVWAYKLDRNNPGSNPKDMSWDEEYGWTYAPPTVDSIGDFLKDYMNPGCTYGSSGGQAESVLPIVKIKQTGKLHCVNYNSYAINQNMQESVLEYGTIPGGVIKPFVGSDGSPSSFRIQGFATTSVSSFLGSLFSGAGQAVSVMIRTGQDAVNWFCSKWYITYDSNGELEWKFVTDDTVVLDDCKVYPTVVSPALWVMELNKYSFDDIKQQGSSARIYRGTDILSIVGSGDNVTVWQGNTKLEMEELEKLEFLRIRTGSASGTQQYLYSETQLNAFNLNKTESSTFADSTMEVLGVGRASTHVDVIDWDEFTLKRLLEDFEFVVAITLVIVLYIIPRVCLFVFLMLLSLGVIQNIRLVQWFCDRFFDPYKFLTFGRRNVHTFRPGIAFRNSIIAMAVFALFMDGTIIHFFEWIVQFLAYLLGSR